MTVWLTARDGEDSRRWNLQAIGERIRVVRKSTGMSARDVDRSLGWPHGRMAAFERATAPIHLVEALDIASVLGVSVDDFGPTIQYQPGRNRRGSNDAGRSASQVGNSCRAGTDGTVPLPNRAATADCERFAIRRLSRADRVAQSRLAAVRNEPIGRPLSISQSTSDRNVPDPLTPTTPMGMSKT